MDDLTRRAFLKAAGLAAAGFGASFAATPGWAQDPTRGKRKRDEERDRQDPPEGDEDASDESEQEDRDLGDEPVAEETRACPQCGDFMYKQGDTWTCDTCGYSYVE